MYDVIVTKQESIKRNSTVRHSKSKLKSKVHNTLPSTCSERSGLGVCGQDERHVQQIALKLQEQRVAAHAPIHSQLRKERRSERFLLRTAHKRIITNTYIHTYIHTHPYIHTIKSTVKDFPLVVLHVSKFKFQYIHTYTKY